MSFMVGTIRMWSGDYLPAGWLWCDGAQYSATQYAGLFGVIANNFGGKDGNFAVPDLRGRFPAGMGTRDAHSFAVGQAGGTEAVRLHRDHLPKHDHQPSVTLSNVTPTAFTVAGTLELEASAGSGNQTQPTSNHIANGSYISYSTSNFVTPASAGTLGNVAGLSASVSLRTSGSPYHPLWVTAGNTGSGEPLNIMPPFVAVNYIICAQGVLPVRPH